MTRKRDKPSLSRHVPAPISKRRRPFPRPPHDPSTASAADDDPKASKPAPPPALVVTGLPSNCSVLELKSRFEIYGPISRIRIDRDEVGYITFRSKDSAVAAIGASLDPSFGITVETERVISLPFPLSFLFPSYWYSISELFYRPCYKVWIFTGS